ncbi:hypothetical protein WJX77_006989 [Trebouxia sp. C0004]
MSGLDALTVLTSLCLSGWTHAMLPTAISCLKRLRLLSLQNCSILSLPDSLPQLTDLESLDLHMNDMGSALGGGTTVVSYLDLRGNRPLQVDKRLVSWALSNSTRRPSFDCYHI